MMLRSEDVVEYVESELSWVRVRRLQYYNHAVVQFVIQLRYRIGEIYSTW